ncbi:MAG: tetratricopeptide repeat protein [Pseudonocardiaceae bacterium]
MPSPHDDSAQHRRRRWLPIAILCAGLVLLAASVVGFSGALGAPSPLATSLAAGGPAPDPLSRLIESTQQKLRDDPDDALSWAQLGSAYVEQARVTADPSYYQKAQGALERSMRLQPEGNGEAMIGLGALANARHDFTQARDWALAARELRPATGEVYGVLADALTQLGDTEGATAAVQRMLDTKPGVAAFTRASYDLELHGRPDDAHLALQQALQDSHSPANIAFCRYYLGELAFNSGHLDEAASQYEQGHDAARGDSALRQGRAKVAAARGDLDRALADYQAVTNRVPLPQYLQEYGELLLVAGRPEQAATQFTLFTQQQRLYEAAGSTDDLAVAQFAADHGDPAEALRRAQAEWERRQSVFVADALAWALHANGRNAEALTFADRAASLGWRNATFAYHRGMILAALGMRAEAARQLTEALKINPYFSPLHAPRARAALDELRSTE